MRVASSIPASQLGTEDIRSPLRQEGGKITERASMLPGEARQCLRQALELLCPRGVLRVPGVGGGV